MVGTPYKYFLQDRERIETIATKKVKILQDGKFTIEVIGHNQPSYEAMINLGEVFERLFDKKEKQSKKNAIPK